MTKCLISSLLGLFSALATAAPLDVPLITYYDYPPFTIRQGKSLTQGLAEYLTEHAAGRFRFVVKVIPKGRLDLMLASPDWSGVVAWVNPKFVFDEPKTHYQWTAPIMDEVDFVASQKEKPFEYNGIESLKGMTIGMVLNQRYADVESMIAKGELIRQDAPSQENVVNMLVYKRVEIAFVSKSTLSWFRQDLKDFEQKIHYSQKPRNTFTRHLMLARHLRTDVSEYVLKTVHDLPRNRAWQELMNSFNILDQIPKESN